jgi:uncharacterized protein (DUF1800 family)
MDLPAAHALIRFGLGPRLGEAPPADPLAWLMAQLDGPDPARPDPATLDPAGTRTADGLRALRTDRENRPAPGQSVSRRVFRADAEAALAGAVTAAAPFRERLVWFWTNHFTVSLRQAACAPLVGAFIEDAIRPHVTGRFQDMLLAVMRHPAMLIYLDNAQSVGPDSGTGRRTGRGLNENLARECLELHTVSQAARYGQADVTSFAALLTGWSIDLKMDPPGFRFRPAAHQPGEKTLLGRSFPEGEAGGEAALRFLGTHPATYRALAAALARHFVADDPPPAAVRPIEAALHDTGGDLGAASRALIGPGPAWTPQAKLRTPTDFAIAALRATGLPADRWPDLIGVVGGLGQPIWQAPLPNGWPDRAVDWAAPDAMMRRIDWAHALAGRAAASEPADVAEAALGPLLPEATLLAVRRAGSRQDGLTLLLASPQFQRR